MHQGPSRRVGTDSSPPIAAGEGGSPGKGAGEGGGQEDEEEGGRLQKYAEAGHAPAGTRGQLGDGTSVCHCLGPWVLWAILDGLSRFWSVR